MKRRDEWKPWRDTQHRVDMVLFAIIYISLLLVVLELTG